MGYRSEVASLIYGPKEHMLVFIAKHKLAGTVFEMFKDEVEVIERDTEIFIKLHGDGWKWYPDYEDVKAWHAMMDDARENPALCVEFARVGEEPDDIEVIHDGDECQGYISTHTAISVDF